MSLIPAALLALQLLAGCHPARLDGLYVDTSGITRYEFHEDGTVYISVLGAMVTGSYESNAERVLVTGPQGSVVLFRRGQRLHGPMGLELRAVPRSRPLPKTDAAGDPPLSP